MTALQARFFRFNNGRQILQMQPSSIRDRIRTAAFELLGRHPKGLRFSHLIREIALVDPSLNAGTIRTVVWSLDKVSADLVYKPKRGLFRLVVFKEPVSLKAHEEGRRQARDLVMETKVTALFAEWLEQELQDVDRAVTPTVNLFNGLCGTPTVLGLAETRPSDSEAPVPGIISAQIESQTGGHIDAFGHACAARLYARRSYLVVPKRKRIDELMHLHALCRMFGLGLVLFNDLSIAAPGFRLTVHAVDHDPDPVYESRCMKQLGVTL